ncbi:Formate efflux transporter FocA [Candidatus Syntrophocurvum alkaliphilum]|uniref:Formate efflux transporter FocA n=1 Tax=Candidatus Syntrophocurvum alkaliphilum TaxID=2293317 RepID=A0A6I6DNI8_9FIRM|nr:formate/nitrite transporter family protein [Candidatus Syntrophocurvum alkaliphilum]QGU00518.1 Formate efflux transporter FocA [Candidatus Syntrophocurvum alkaliphilum]
MNFQTPAEVAAAAANSGKAKAELPIGKMILLGILAGAYIAFGANLATVVTQNFSGQAFEIFLFGGVFSVGLMMTVIGGAELFTGNNMFCVISNLNGQASIGGTVYNWVVVYFANLIGSLLLVFLVYNSVYWTDGASLTAVGERALGIATGKLNLTWEAAFLRGILCNWLVCMAVWLALAAKDVIGKIFSCFFPIMAFVASGFEHSIANMFFIPMGIAIANGAAALGIAVPSAEIFTYGNFVFANLIPVTLGNIVGAVVFVSGFYWYTYLRK